jgi:hypothetical protein
MYEKFNLSTETGTFVHGGDFVQAVTYRAITLAMSRPWDAVRLQSSSASHKGVADQDLEEGVLEPLSLPGQPLSVWLDHLMITLEGAVLEILAEWGNLDPPPPPAETPSIWSGDDALVPIPRDGGHRMLLFVHDRPQARGLAAARALYETSSESDLVKVGVSRDCHSRKARLCRP